MIVEAEKHPPPTALCRGGLRKLVVRFGWSVGA